MKLKTHISKEVIHKSPLSCIDWSSNEEIFSVSDDHQIYKWNSMNRDTVEVAKLPDDFIPTDMDWLLGRGGGGKGGDTLLISSSDGRFIILNKSARVERNISAHSLAISSGRWSPDGAGLLTASEDGVIKIWSRSGMLRSTVVQSDEPIRFARWSPNSSAIVFCQGGFISIKPLAANSKITRWRAHDGLVLCLSWSSQNDLIASGGEDCRFKLWDSQGANIYTSPTDDYAITAIDYNPEKDVLVVGSFNSLKLCSSSGWSHENTRFNNPPVGSVYGISWSPDGTQIACGTSTGFLIVGHIVEKQLISRNLKATTTGRKSVLLEDITNNTSDVLDFPDRVINFGLAYGHLIVATSTQIQIYNEKYLNTPIIIEGKSDVRALEVCKKFFLVLDSTAIWVYNYTGRLHVSPRYPGSQAQIPLLTKKCISLGLDVLAIRDSSDTAVVYTFDLIPGASRQYEPHPIRSKSQVVEIACCRAGSSDDQFMVFLDTNRELYITPSRNLSDNNEIFKIGTQVISVMWASETNILLGLHDACFSVWYCPAEGAADPTIIALTTVTIDTADLGKNISIESFEDAIVSFRSSGALLSISVNMYCEILHRTLMDGQWQQALKICRLAQNTILWATLAAIATRKNQLQISEEAYAAALQVDKVSYLQYIKKMLQQTLAKLTGRPTILVTHPEVAQEAIDILTQKCKVIMCQNVPSVRSDILDKSKGVDGILWADANQRLNGEVLDAAGPQLKSISTMSAGVDYVDIAELKRRKILLGHTPLVLDKTVADLAIGLMISAARRFYEGRLAIETSTWHRGSIKWMLGQDIRGATVGFFGFGNIARTIADRLVGFEIGNIIYNTRKVVPEADKYQAKHVAFDQLLEDSDILFIATPLTPETEGKFNDSAFNKMKSNAVLVNIARGKIVDQKALYDALKSNKIFSAGIDVMYPEPIPADDPILTLPNCVVSPHLGSATVRTRRDMAVLATHNLLQGLAGEPMFAPVYEL